MPPLTWRWADCCRSLCSAAVLVWAACGIITTTTPTTTTMNTIIIMNNIIIATIITTTTITINIGGPRAAGPRHIAFHPNGRTAYVTQACIW